MYRTAQDRTAQGGEVVLGFPATRGTIWRTALTIVTHNDVFVMNAPPDSGVTVRLIRQRCHQFTTWRRNRGAARVVVAIAARAFTRTCSVVYP